MSEQLSTFDAAVIAFEVRFEAELLSRWQNLEYEVDMVSTPSYRKGTILHRFFEEATNEIGSVVHEYFPRLLIVAANHRQKLGNESPLRWTQAQVLRQVCNFLGVDEKFDHTSPPRDDSRLTITAARLALGFSWTEDANPADFLLPGWVDGRWSFKQVLLPESFRKESDAESLPPLSRAETLEWIKFKEFWISRRLERQIENDSWDGIIEAGKSNASVLDAVIGDDQEPVGQESTPQLSKGQEYNFVREAATWAISFGQENCRLKTMIGLDYIAVLLLHPGKPIRALELQTLAGGLSSSSSAKRAATSWRDSNFAEKTDDRDDRCWEQNDFGRQDMIDDKTRREAVQRLSEIERRTVYAQDRRDMEEVDRLRDEYQSIQSYLRAQSRYNCAPIGGASNVALHARNGSWFDGSRLDG